MPINDKFEKYITYIEIDGMKIRYASIGSGRPLFMLHGWGGDLHSWKPLAGYLSKKKYKIFSLDMPGFGKSAMPKKAWCIADYSAFIEKFVQKIYTKYGLKGGYNVVVHSFGGRVILKLFETPGDLKSPTLNRIVFIAPAGIKHSLSFSKRVLQNIAKFGAGIFDLPPLRLFKRSARKLMYGILRVHDYENTSGVMRKTFLNVIGEDLTGNLEQINCPTLIVWGTDDTYVPVSDAYIMDDKIKNSSLKIIKGGRHGIHKTHAKEIGGWIDEFIG